MLEQLYVTGSNVSVSDVQGELTILSVEVDHRLADWHLDPGSWRPARPFPVSLVDPPVVLEPGASAASSCRLYLGRAPAGQQGPQNAQVSGFARITPVDHARHRAGAGHHRAPAPRPPTSRGSGIALTYPGPPSPASRSTASRSRCASWTGSARCRWSAPRARCPTSRPRSWSSSRRPARWSPPQLLVADGHARRRCSPRSARPGRRPHRPAQPRRDPRTTCAATRSASGCGCSWSSARPPC